MNEPKKYDPPELTPSPESPNDMVFPNTDVDAIRVRMNPVTRDALKEVADGQEDEPEANKVSEFHSVTRPAGYNQGSIEVIQLNKHMDYCLGNAVKYIARYKLKDGIRDLKKARQYLRFYLDLDERVDEDVDDFIDANPQLDGFQKVAIKHIAVSLERGMDHRMVINYLEDALELIEHEITVKK